MNATIYNDFPSGITNSSIAKAEEIILNRLETCDAIDAVPLVLALNKLCYRSHE